MKIKNKKINIYKDKIKRFHFLKYEIKKIILKSIIQNNNLKPLIKIKANYILSKLPYKSNLSKQNNNICLKSGRIKGVYNEFNISRHYIKKLGTTGNLQNINIKSW